MSRSSFRRALPGIALVTLALFQGRTLQGQNAQEWQRRREEMVQHACIEAGISNPRVLDSMRQTPRHLFVPRHLRAQAYLDMALPIGEQQTISSPFIVAFMTECLDPQAQDRVLEIGTGSGYQAAVLSSLVDQVYTIEIVNELGEKAIRTLRQGAFRNVTVRIGDGFKGWEEQAPFDKIIVTCSPENVPQPLIDQLKDGGRMVIPVGERYQQTMYLYRKVDGKLEQEALRPTLFVPMTGAAESARVVQPDPRNPRLLNSDFEEAADAQGFVKGWYYQRQAELITNADAPNGKHYVQFQNLEPGHDSHLMQGLAIDGKTIRNLKVSCFVRTQGVRSQKTYEGPRLVISFYDKDRRELGFRWLGPWDGDNEWQQHAKTLTVPANAREIILRIGLFGATGTAAFDQIDLSVVD
ncbi:MAG: protein-L-isoaspartate(D-aspartate) O-methyltransferase [Planctomycetales bacterium]|nr:protein-L-isoaspartate(D-aspartate) O-methyltransferase [Planctomycetales bacterium]